MASTNYVLRHRKHYALAPAAAASAVSACQLSHISPKIEKPTTRKVVRATDLHGRGATIKRERAENLAMSRTSAGWIITRPHIPAVAGNIKTNERGKCGELSYQSLANLRYVAAHTPVTFRSMITLTYPSEFPTDQERIKRDLDVFLKALRRKTHSAFSYLWVLEFQKRGAPHFHIWVTHDFSQKSDLVELKRKAPKQPALVSMEMHNWCAETWYDIVGSNDAKHLRAGTCWELVRKIDGARRYIVKECAKKHQKKLPEGWNSAGRWWGASRDVRKAIPRPEPLSESDVEKMLAALPENCFNPRTTTPFRCIWTPPTID